jgi:hypothetical protein
LNDKAKSKTLTYDYLIETFKDDLSLANVSKVADLADLFSDDRFIYEAYRMLFLMKACNCGDREHKSCLIPILQELQKEKQLSLSNQKRFIERHDSFPRNSVTIRMIRELIHSSGLDLSIKTSFMERFFDPEAFRKEVISKKTKEAFNYEDALGHYSTYTLQWERVKRIIEEVYLEDFPKFLRCTCGSVDCIERILRQPGALPGSLKFLTKDKIEDFVQYAFQVDQKAAMHFFHVTLPKKLDAVMMKRFGDAFMNLADDEKKKRQFYDEILRSDEAPKEENKKKKTYKYAVVFKDVAERETVLEHGFLANFFGQGFKLEKDRSFYVIVSFDAKLKSDPITQFFEVLPVTKEKRKLLKAVKTSEVFPKQLKAYLRDDIVMTRRPYQQFSEIPAPYEGKTMQKEWERIYKK